MGAARLKAVSRANVAIPPVAIYGPCLTIRKFGREVLSPEQIVSSGGATAAIMGYLDAAVGTRLNILVSAGTGSGKTTIINVLAGSAPGKERIATWAAAAQRRARQLLRIRVQSKPPDI